MKIAFTTSGSDLNAPLDGRFGRAPRFLVYDNENETCQVLDNEQNLNAMQGAGIQSAEIVANLGVDAVVTGHCGPKAFHVLQAAGIKVYNCDASTVAEALTMLKENKLTAAQAADVQGHWV